LITGNNPVGKLCTTKEGHMEGLETELMHRGVCVQDLPRRTKDRKKKSKELECKRLQDEDGLPKRKPKAKPTNSSN